MNTGFNSAVRTALLVILCTVPLIYGARHPLIHGMYSSTLLLLCGIFFVINFEEYKNIFRCQSFLLLCPLVLIAYIFFSSISLPLPLLELLSSHRADSLLAAREIGGADNQQTAIAYYAPTAAFYGVYGLSLFFLFHIGTSSFQSRTFLRKFLFIVTFIGTFEAIYGLLQAMNPDLGVLWSSTANDQYRGMARGTIIYRNQYALFLNLCWPAAAAYGIALYRPIVAKYKSKLKRHRKMTLSRTISHFSDKAALPIFCSALMILAILLSQSRAGIITLALSALLFNILLPISRKTKLSAFGILCAIILFYGMLIGGFDEIAQRFEQFVAGVEGRLTIWLASLSLLQDHLLTGIGMGGYEWLSPLYLENVPNRIWFDRAHNEYLELTIELGMPVAILLFAWIVLGLINFTRIVSTARKANASLEHFSMLDFTKIGAFCSVIAFVLHGFVDLVWRLPVNLIYVVALLALLSANQPEASPKKVRR